MAVVHRKAKRRPCAGEQLFQAIFMAMDEGAILQNESGDVVAVNRAAENILGLAAADLVGRSSAEVVQGLGLVHEDGSPLSLDLHSAMRRLQSGQAHRDLRVGAYRPDGALVWLSVNMQALSSDGEAGPYAVVTTLRDITELKRADEYERFRSQTLELLSGSASLQEVLEGIARGVEQLSPGMICSILLLDGEGKRFLKGIGPSLPDSYNEGLDGLEIGIGVGSCGTAAATGERVVVEDIMTHPYWASYKEIAANAGLAACWSEPIRSSSGRVLGTFAAYHREVHSPAIFDISIIEESTRLASIAIERRQAEEALRASEREFRTLAENLPDILVRYDRDGRRTYANPALRKSLAIMADQLIGKTLRETNPAGIVTIETYQRALEHTLATGERSEFEVDIALPGGELRTGHCFIAAEREADGQISGAIAVARDITERKRMESDIRRREREYRTLVENSPDPIFRYDRECRRLFVHTAGIRKTGQSVESMIGSGPADGRVLAGDQAEKLMAVIRQVFDSGASSSVDLDFVDGYGNHWDYEMLLVPEADDQGEVATVLGLAHDITTIRNAERRMTEFVANLPGFAFTFRLSPEGHGSFPFVSPGIERLAGLKPEAVKNDMGPMLALAHPDDMPRIIAAFNDSARTMTPLHVDFRADRLGLPARWTELRSVPLRQADGSILWHGIMLDIDERKRMESEVRCREQEFRSLAENSPDPIFRYDRDCRRIYANPASGVMSGHPVESLVGATPSDGQLLGPDDAARLTAAIRRVFDSGEPDCVDTVSVDRDGRRRNYQVLLVPEDDGTGSVAAVLGLARDITAIRDAERRMTDFIANLPGFAFTFRLSPAGHGSFPFASPGIENLVGLKPEDVKDDMAPLLALAHPDDAPRILAAIDESARTMMPYHQEARACRPGLPERWVELRGLPLRQADGSILWHGIMLDIDERKRNEAELERHRHHLEKLVEERTLALSIAKETAEAATRAKTHFLAAASHDLRQPLQAIRLFNDTLTRTGLDEEQKRINRYVSKAVDSLGGLLNDLLDISRLDAGVIKPQSAAIDAEDLLGIIGAEFDAVSREKNLRLNLFCPRPDLALFSDNHLLLTMLRNLVSNAVKYTTRGGVLVGIRRRGDRALIQVWDTGIGIAADKIDSIFEEYFQIGNPERDRAKGVGLGLAIVRRLSRLLGIAVRFRSREGRGSVFELSVPLASESDRRVTSMRTAARPETSASARLAGKRIVVVDDDASAGEAIKLSLETDGVHVTLFGTAEDALGSAATIGADYYISDFRLPGMNGLQLLDAIQRNSAEPIKAVVLTGNTSPDQIAAIQSSRWKVLFKPVGLPRLLSALDAH